MLQILAAIFFGLAAIPRIGQGWMVPAGLCLLMAPVAHHRLGG